MALEINGLRVQLRFTGLTRDNYDTFRDGLDTKLANISIPGVSFVPEVRFHEFDGAAEVEVHVEGVTDLADIKAIMNGGFTQFHEVDHGGGIESTMFRCILDTRPEAII